MKQIRLLLIEDNRLLRDGIAKMLKNQGDIKIIAAHGKNDNTSITMKQLNPNIILLDLGLRSQNSLNLVKDIKKSCPNAKVIIMDLAPVPSDINLFVKAGASGFILKDASINDFLLTIRSVAKGENILPDNLAESLFFQIVERAIKDSKVKIKKAVSMSKREREIIGLIGDGLSNKEIAKDLHVSIPALKSHIHNIMEKLALHSRLEVVNYSSANSIKGKNIVKSLPK
jgi:DNA-binding NarL/FixJ family response regulator